MAQTKFQELNLKDAFLFAAALQNPDTCGLVMELILGRPVGPVQVHVEHSLLYSSDFRYVRLDVYAIDGLNVLYDVEMQNSHKEELPKRARFHQAEMDATCLKPGQSFCDLPPSYVIFICTYDPFYSGLYRYTYEERCRETGEVLGDETCKIYLSTKGTNDDEVPQELIHFLKYVEDSTEAFAEESCDEKIQELHRKVEACKKSRRLEESYMTMEEYMQDLIEDMIEDREAEKRAEGKAEGRAEGIAEGRAEGIAEGRAEGIAEGRAEGEALAQLMLDLVARMAADGLAGEIPKLKEDEAFYKAMLKKYDLK